MVPVLTSWGTDDITTHLISTTSLRLGKRQEVMYVSRVLDDICGLERYLEDTILERCEE